MSGYDNQLCSVFLPNGFVEQPSQPVQKSSSPHQPRVCEDLTPQKAAEEVSAKKRSCLSANSARRGVPSHPATRRKTVAFGRTVNVSQTVEGTSRPAKKVRSASASSSATSSPAQKMVEENQEDWKKVMKNELDTIRKEMHEETVRKQEEMNKENLNRMQEMMSKFFEQLTVRQPAIENKESSQEKRIVEKPKPKSKIFYVRQAIKNERILPPEAIPILEKRLQSDPIFRQQIDDVLADAEYQESNGEDSYSDPVPVSEARYAGGGNRPTMRETVTVERSIRYDNGLHSVDSRQWTKESDGRSIERWRTYEAPAPEPPALQSTYHQGSYYPSVADTRRNKHVRDGGYYVEPLSEQSEEEDVDEVVEYQQPAVEESRAERERRIREKYARRN